MKRHHQKTMGTDAPHRLWRPADLKSVIFIIGAAYLLALIFIGTEGHRFTDDLIDGQVFNSCPSYDTLNFSWSIVMGNKERLLNVTFYLINQNDPEEKRQYLGRKPFDARGNELPFKTGNYSKWQSDSGISLQVLEMSYETGGFYIAKIDLEVNGVYGLTNYTMERNVTLIVRVEPKPIIWNLEHLSLWLMRGVFMVNGNYSVGFKCGIYEDVGLPSNGVVLETPDGETLDMHFEPERKNLRNGSYTLLVPYSELSNGTYYCSQKPGLCPVAHNPPLPGSYTLDTRELQFELMDQRGMDQEAPLEELVEKAKERARIVDDLIDQLRGRDTIPRRDERNRMLDDAAKAANAKLDAVAPVIDKYLREAAFQAALDKDHKEPGTVVYQAVSLNRGNYYHADSGRFKALYKGLYVFAITLRAKSRSYPDAAIMWNAEAPAKLCYATSLLPGDHADCHAVVELDTGDEVWVEGMSWNTGLWGTYPYCARQCTLFGGFMVYIDNLPPL